MSDLLYIYISIYDHSIGASRDNVYSDEVYIRSEWYHDMYYYYLCCVEHVQYRAHTYKTTNNKTIRNTPRKTQKLLARKI